MYEATVISSQYLKYKKLPSIAVSESEAWMGCCELNVPILSREEFIEKAFSVRKNFIQNSKSIYFGFWRLLFVKGTSDINIRQKNLQVFSSYINTYEHNKIAGAECWTEYFGKIIFEMFICCVYQTPHLSHTSLTPF